VSLHDQAVGLQCIQLCKQALFPAEFDRACPVMDYQKCVHSLQKLVCYGSSTRNVSGLTPTEVNSAWLV
jgi:hypothetical protein